MVQRNPKFSLLIKYTADKILAIILLLLTTPVFIWVAIRLKILGEDVFYHQKRVGYLGQDFFCYKFTTMPKGSEKAGYITTTDDERPFKFGKFLRKTKINEIPQLINVLLGDMSFVGPRPLIREQMMESFNPEEIIEYYSMRPGITGAGSLYYHHEDELLACSANPHQYYRDVIMPHKFELERQYADNWNLVRDIKIFLKTVIRVILPSRDKILDK
ncbi:MAG: sugar transferase [Fidelibacterota bacterium]